MLYFDYETTIRKRAQSQVIADATRAAAAVPAYKGRHGKYPSQLADAMRPDPVHDDPFDGKPLRYKLDADGFVVYSVGQDGKFDGGEPGKVKGRYDVLFRFPMPTYYAKEISGK